MALFNLLLFLTASMVLFHVEQTSGRLEKLDIGSHLSFADMDTYDAGRVQKIASSSLHPVLIIPSPRTSRLEARHSSADLPSKTCGHKPGEWYNAVFASDDDNSYFTNRWNSRCFKEVLGIHWSRGRGPTLPEGVEIRAAPGLGGIESISDRPTGRTNKNLIDNLEKYGYVRERNLRSLNYDWRFGFGFDSELVNEMADMVEDLYKSNGNKRVILASFGLSSVGVRYFLGRVTQDWKDKHLLHWIATSPNWYGSPEIFKFVHFGIIADFQTIRSGLYANMQATENTWPFMYAAFPRDWTDPNVDEIVIPLVESPKATYYPHDLAQLFRSRNAGLDDRAAYIDESDVLYDPEVASKHPGVAMDVAYALGLETLATLVVDDDEWYRPDVANSLAEGADGVTQVFVDGDGLTPGSQHGLVKKWRNDAAAKKYKVQMKEFSELSWAQLQHDHEWADWFFDRLGSINKDEMKAKAKGSKDKTQEPKTLPKKDSKKKG